MSIKQFLTIVLISFLTMVTTWQCAYIKELKSFFRPVYIQGFISGCEQGYGLGAERDAGYKFEPLTHWCEKQAEQQ